MIYVDQNCDYDDQDIFCVFEGNPEHYVEAKAEYRKAVKVHKAEEKVMRKAFFDKYGYAPNYNDYRGAGANKRFWADTEAWRALWAAKRKEIETALREPEIQDFFAGRDLHLVQVQVGTY